MLNKSVLQVAIGVALGLVIHDLVGGFIPKLG
jgi:hypothetical protein